MVDKAFYREELPRRIHSKLSNVPEPFRQTIISCLQYDANKRADIHKIREGLANTLEEFEKQID